MKKKTSWVKVMAIVTAIVGVGVAVVGFLKKKSKRLSDELDFDNSMFLDDDAPMLTEDDLNDDESDEAETVSELDSLDIDDSESEEESIDVTAKEEE